MKTVGPLGGTSWERTELNFRGSNRGTHRAPNWRELPRSR